MSTTDYGRRDQDSKKVIVIIVISILLGVNGLLLWQFFDKKTHLEQVVVNWTVRLLKKNRCQQNCSV